MTCVVIMAGGRGERFWPKSRVGQPKQFTDITGGGNMLYHTFRRVAGLVGPEKIFVVTGHEYEKVTRDSLPELPAANIILEPEGRNTAPCIGLATIVIENRYPGATMVVLPADHYIVEVDNFLEDLRLAVKLAEDTNGLVTLGIQPTRPETGYGYLKTGPEKKLGSDKTAYKVERFVEKPDLENARKFLAEGCYLWNAGIFIWKTKTILQAYKDRLPEIYEGLGKIAGILDKDRYQEKLRAIYAGFPKTSVDYGIMEKASDVYTVPGHFNWDDVGTWRSLERIFGTDDSGNVIQGNAVILDTNNTIVDSRGRLVAVIGAEDLIIVDTDDITFVCHKNKSDVVRELLDELRSRKMEKYL